MSNEHKCQVDLRGVITLLSDHLYSGPQVYIRELLQNAVDAITARSHLDPAPSGAIHLEVIEASNNRPPTLVVHDNGIGLTQGEVHQFLATIGQSSKREALLTFLIAALPLVELLARQKRKTRKLRLPQTLPCYREDSVYHTVALADWLCEETEAVAARFNRRNGNDYYTQIIEDNRKFAEQVQQAVAKA